ncbi:hypothetical protein F5Y18DRAFT_46193 [Xylariaceae sp. FL1019]|nr:hypothetical protein F5Y18DRAFT_46193 [Xylariaceae sp. FL1019]
MNMQFGAQPGFASPYVFPPSQGNGIPYNDGQYSMQPNYPGLQYMFGYPTHRAPLLTDRGGLCDGKSESKPRLSKEEVEKLEKVFQENPKPSSSVKAQLADGLGLERPRINNWFQNRRAKAKQERKQEEYEARRVAEKTSSEPTSSDEDSPSATDSATEGSPKRTQPSSAAFPDVSSPSEFTDSTLKHEEDYDDDDEDDEDGDSEENSHIDANNDIRALEYEYPSTAHMRASVSEASETYNSPRSLDFSQHDVAAYNQSSRRIPQSRSTSDYGLFTSPLSHDTRPVLDEQDVSYMSPRAESTTSSECHTNQSYAGMLDGRYTNSSTPTAFFQSLATGACDGSIIHFEEGTSPDYQNGQQATHVMSQGMPTPTDSFRSPPPPANLASRRNIARPAALQAASLKSRSFNLGGIPKTAMDGTKRIDTSSPVSSMRRISSATGSGAGRIQKCTAGPRSPLFFGRNAEALLQYHSRSPVGSGTPTLNSAAPPTPMTPALYDHRNSQEPVVASGCSDDGSFTLNASLATHFMQLKQQDDLKTPPTTPGLMNDYQLANFTSNNFGSCFNVHADQPLLTPFFQSEFPDLTIQNIPSYVSASDGLPSTPIYAGIGQTVDHVPFASNTQYDWDANESVDSSRSSPGHSMPKQIQFTNITPQNYVID